MKIAVIGTITLALCSAFAVAQKAPDNQMVGKVAPAALADSGAGHVSRFLELVEPLPGVRELSSKGKVKADEALECCWVLQSDYNGHPVYYCLCAPYVNPYCDSYHLQCSGGGPPPAASK